MVPARVRERGRVEIRELRGERAPELRPGARLFGEDVAREHEHRLEVDAAEIRRVSEWRASSRSRTGWHERSEQRRVVGRHEVQRPAHHHDADHLADPRELRERLGIEPDEP